MLVTLAYPHDGHAPNETIEVTDALGAQMIRDGLARVPDLEHGDPVPEAPAKNAPTEEWVAYAELVGVDVAPDAHRAEIIGAVEQHLQDPDRATTPDSPPDGDDT
jgi:hypothetical protein